MVQRAIDQLTNRTRPSVNGNPAGNGTNRQPVTNNTTVLLGFAITCSSDVVNGLEIGFDLGSALSTTGHTVTVAEVDLQIVPGTSAPGLATPPIVNLPAIAETRRICDRYCETTYDDGTAIGTAANFVGAIYFRFGDVVGGEITQPFIVHPVSFRQPKGGAPTVLCFSPNSGIVNRVYDPDNSSNIATGGTIINTGTFAGFRSRPHRLTFPAPRIGKFNG